MAETTHMCRIHGYDDDFGEHVGHCPSDGVHAHPTIFVVHTHESSPRSYQCKFVNTMGMRCDELITEESAVCARHRCIYVDANSRICQNVTDCATRNYCKEHGAQCLCQYAGGNKRCGNTIYITYQRHGYRYCEEHRCRVPDCRGMIYRDEPKLCYAHYSRLTFCAYHDTDGSQCCNYTEHFEDDLPVKVQSSAIFWQCSDEHESGFGDRYYCDKHRCKVPSCKKSIINGHSRWCIHHTHRCEFSTSDGKRCENYHLWNVKPEDAPYGYTPCGFCNVHRCHWSYDKRQCEDRCTQKIANVEDNTLFCMEHYRKYLFERYEYRS